MTQRPNPTDLALKAAHWNKPIATPTITLLLANRSHGPHDSKWRSRDTGATTEKIAAALTMPSIPPAAVKATHLAGLQNRCVRTFAWNSPVQSHSGNPARSQYRGKPRNSATPRELRIPAINWPVANPRLHARTHLRRKYHFR